jgi:methylmalonyl-CoA mutase
MSMSARPDNDLSLASDFDAATDTDWRALVEKTLRGKPFDKVMTSQSYDGIAIDALSTERPDVARIALDGSAWDITVPHWDPDAKACNEAVLDDLLRGATGIAIRLEAGAFPGVSVGELPNALNGVYLDMARVTLIPGEAYEAGAAAFMDYVEAEGVAHSSLRGCLGIDPIGTLAQSGRLLEPASLATEKGALFAGKLIQNNSGLAAFMADGGLYHVAGATEAQELGLMLATGLAYLRALEASGLDLDSAASQIHFSLAADADIFLTMAKFRAARLLWARILQMAGVSNDARMSLSAVSSLRMMSINDPWVNILRATAACFGAGVGGADNVCILPHDTMIGMSSEKARRIARNVQIVLQEESSLAKVADPAAGSNSIEDITLKLSDTAWKYMQKIESCGGVLDALRSGAIQQDLQESWSRKVQNLSTRRDAITGVSEFPDIDETAISDVGAMPAPIADIDEAGDKVTPVAFHRSAEGYEKMRAFSDLCLKKDSARPSIFIANIGKAADFTARATFAKNLFEAGGIQAVVGSGGDEPAAIAAEFVGSGCQLAVICSSDDMYAACGVAVTAAITAGGARFVYLAGKPKNQDELAAAGIGGKIFVGCNVLETLANAHVMLGEGA